MANHVLRYKATATGAVTVAPVVAFVNNTDQQVEVRFIADRATHISMVGTATASDARVPADCIELLQIDPGTTLSVLKDAAEPDGNFWVTEIQRV